jgi:hypothetical protein
METDVTLDVRGATYNVELNGSRFEAYVGDQRYQAESVEKLREKLVKATRAAKLDIRFCRPKKDGSVAYGTVTGMHASARALLVHWNEGRREQIASYQCNDMLEALTHAQAAELYRLTQDAAATAARVAAFKAAHKLDAWKAAKEATEAPEEDKA